MTVCQAALMRAFGIALSLSLLAGCAHIDADKILGAAQDISEAAQKVARIQLSIAAALAQEGDLELCQHTAEPALFVLAGAPFQLEVIAHELGLKEAPPADPAKVQAKRFCAIAAEQPRQPLPPSKPPVQPSRWVTR